MMEETRRQNTSERNLRSQDSQSLSQLFATQHSTQQSNDGPVSSFSSAVNEENQRSENLDSYIASDSQRISESQVSVNSELLANFGTPSPGRVGRGEEEPPMQSQINSDIG